MCRVDASRFDLQLQGRWCIPRFWSWPPLASRTSSAAHALPWEHCYSIRPQIGYQSIATMSTNATTTYFKQFKRPLLRTTQATTTKNHLRSYYCSYCDHFYYCICKSYENCYATTAIVASVLLLAKTSRMIVYPFACVAEMGCQTEANKPSFIASTSKSILCGCSLLDTQIHNCGVRHLLCVCVYLRYGFETSSEILPKSAFARSICQAQLFAMFVHNTTRRTLGSTWSSHMMPKKNLQQRLRDSGMSWFPS